MKVLDTTYKRKSATITAIILLLLLFAIFNFGMKYLDPPVEYGLAINFGNSEVGSGEPIENTQEQATEEEVEEQQEEVEEQIEEQSSSLLAKATKEEIVQHMKRELTRS